MNNLIFCDIDGTIIDGTRGMNNVSLKTKKAIRQLIENGDYVFIASGRNKGLLSKEIKDLNPSGFVLCNGAYAQIGDKCIFSKSFDDLAVDKIKMFSLKYNGFYILETIDDVHVHSLHDEAFLYFMENWGLNLQGFIENKQVDSDFHIAMIGFLDENSSNKAIKELEQYVDIARHNTAISFDINVKGISKASGVKKVIEYLDIPFDNTYCFGDGLNDLEMLNSVKHPVIMANAHEKLKTFDFEITDDVLDDGFYNYLLVNKLIKEC